MNIDLSSTDFDYLDPALAYADWSWQFTYLMNCKLLNYPDKNAPEGTKLQAEAADFPVVSKGGTVYTFTIKPDAGGCKFNTGEKVTAQSFADAINRDLNPAMASPAVQFITDIVGASDVAAGKGTTASGVVVNGNKLTITLTKPSADFLARIALPFFSAIPHGMPVNGKGETTFASAGPYMVSNWTQGRSAEFDRNPNYTGKRPRNVSKFLVTVNTDPDQAFLQVKSGQVDDDVGGPPPTQKQALLQAGLLNKQLFISPTASTTWVAMNTSRGIFQDVNARKAVNYAVDRHAMLSAFGVLAGTRDDQFMAPAVPGYKKANIYPTKAWYGYGISIELASEGLVIDDVLGERVRHVVTTDGIDGAQQREGEVALLEGRQRRRLRPQQAVPGRPGDDPPVQPEADRDRRERAVFPGGDVLRQGRHEGRGVRRGSRYVGLGLPGPLRLPERLLRRQQHSRQQQPGLLVLQRRLGQQAAREGCFAQRRRALRGVRQPGRVDCEGLRAAREPVPRDASDVLLGAHGPELLRVSADLRSARPRGRVLQVGRIEQRSAAARRRSFACRIGAR